MNQKNIHTITIHRKTDPAISIKAPHGQLCYDAIEEAGFQYPHGCLAGSCGACLSEVIEGAENLSPPGAIEQVTLKRIISEDHSLSRMKNLRLACRASVCGDISIQSK